MRSFRTRFVSAALLAAVVFAATTPASSRDKRCPPIPSCQQPTTTVCAPNAAQSLVTQQTCCQPKVASVQPQIELVKYERPASPRRLIPQPDALQIGQTSAMTACAIYMAFDFGSIQLYYGVICPTNIPTAIYGNGLAPLPGNCANPNGACITSGASVIPTAFARNGIAEESQSIIQKGAHLSRKLRVGQEPTECVGGRSTSAQRTVASRTGNVCPIQDARQFQRDCCCRATALLGEGDRKSVGRTLGNIRRRIRNRLGSQWENNQGTSC